MNKSLARVVYSKDGHVERLLEALPSLAGASFCLCAGGTLTSDLEGISAAGTTPMDRRLTPKLDAEALLLGTTVNGEGLPVSPEGIVSPVVVTRACLSALPVETRVFNCGMFHAPEVPAITAGTAVGDCISSGQSLADRALPLFLSGFQAGRDLSADKDLIVIAECVPGGTTSAMAVLTALGFRARDSVSSSLPSLDRDQRWQLVERGLRRAGLLNRLDTGIVSPLAVLQAVGDPMQPFALGMCLGAAQTSRVLLAGGTQMIAVYSLMHAVLRRRRHLDQKSDSCSPAHSQEGGVELPLHVMHELDEQSILRHVVVATTRWVVEDRNARVRELCREVDCPLVCSTISLRASRHAGLRAYEEGHVKEGVGAGSALILAALLGGMPEKEIIALIDRTYDLMVPAMPAGRS